MEGISEDNTTMRRSLIWRVWISGGLLALLPTLLSQTVAAASESTLNRSDVIRTISDATATTMMMDDVMRTQCAAEEYHCVNGPMANLSSCGKCNCTQDGYDVYYGMTCDRLNLTIATFSTSTSSLHITWPLPLNLAGEYYFVYREEYDLPLVGAGLIITYPLNMPDNRTAVLTGLASGMIKYVVCIMDSNLAQNISDDNSISRVAVAFEDCIAIETQDTLAWGHHVAFYVVCSTMGVILLVIIVLGVTKQRYEEKKYELFDDQEEEAMRNIRDAHTGDLQTGSALEETVTEMPDESSHKSLDESGPETAVVAV